MLRADRINVKFAAAALSLIICCAYILLMRADASWGLLQPRGGLLTLSFSLILANAAIWMSFHGALNSRFQFAVAGWLWLVVQAGGIFFLLASA